jgi:peptidyl-prolyl cis-trans isomerase D
MLKTLQSKDLMVRIFLGVILGIISLGMLLYLVPAPVSSLDQGTDGLADVAGERITTTEVRRQLDKISQRQSIPRVLQGFYARQILDQIIFDRLLELEAQRLGLQVTDQEETERIKLLVPDAFVGGNWVGEGKYAAEVQLRFGMGVEEFEEQVRRSLLEEKFRRLITEGIAVSPEEVLEEFRRRNEKVKIEYVLLSPTALEAQVHADDPELQAYFDKQKASYQVPERRSARYALLDLNLLRQHLPISDETLRAYYGQHLDLYKIPNRIHVEHILFKTVGKTDAEVAEIRKKAEEALQKAKHGAKFEDLAKQYSDDTTKDKGGDLGWIVQGQTVPEFEQVAFSLPKGAISDLVRTQYGFHIIKVLEHETARTQSFEEVRASILPLVQSDQVQALEDKNDGELADAVRKSTTQPLEDVVKSLDPLARQCVVIRESPLVSADQPLGELGNSSELRDALFRQRASELSQPMRTERGIVVLTVKDIATAHQGTFVEVRSRVEADYRKEKGVELARDRAQELAHRAGAGEDLAHAAKALSLEVKTSDPFARNGSVAGLGGASQLAAAFTMTVGQTSPATSLTDNWVVYRVVSRDEPNPDDFAKQSKDIQQELLTTKRQAAFEAFRKALEDQMRREGKLHINPENLKRLISPS